MRVNAEVNSKSGVCAEIYKLFIKAAREERVGDGGAGGRGTSKRNGGGETPEKNEE